VTKSTKHWLVWGQYLAVAAAYAAFYRVAFQLSVSHWELTVGFRLCCLLLVPMRLWPALALGEFLPVMENALTRIDVFGSAWALAVCVPQIVVCMAGMKPLRRWGSLRMPDGTIRMGYVIVATLCCAFLSTLRDTAALWAALSSSSTETAPWSTLSIGFSSYLLGGYLGGLTVAPAILAIQDRMQVEVSLRALWHSPLFRDVCVWLLPVLTVLTLQANAATALGEQQLLRLAMILPMVSMSWRYGWHGAAVAGSAASLAMALTSDSMRDPAVIYCQAALALSFSASLLLGGRPQPAAQPLLQEG
jgi:glucose-6-phosphate-specific signal transduction histidine kinase